MAIDPKRAAWRTGTVLLAILCWLAALAGLRHLTAPDEGRYAGVALEMLRSGDWLVPRLDGLPFFHKPPLFYWLGAAAMSVFGVTEWAARLPSVLGGTLAAGALFAFLRRWAEPRMAMVVTVVLVTMPFFFLGAQFANLDMLVAGCISATLLLAVHAALARAQDAPWHAALAGAFALAALGVLAKGLIGLVLPGAVFLVWCLVTRRFTTTRLMFWWPGWLLFLVIAAPWFIAMQWHYPGFFDYFVVTQHFRRFAAAGFNNAQPFWFYLAALAVLALPWVGWLVAAAVRRRGARPALSDIDWLMLVWFATIVLFFSIPRSKLVGYVLPALPPLAWGVVRALQHMLPHERVPGRALRWSGGAAVVLCLLAVGAVQAFSPPGARLRLPAGQTVQPGEQVLMLDTYFYEIPFYWRLQHPVMLLSRWDDPSIPAADNWRKEISDAAAFEPANAARTLVGAADLSRVLCVPRATWLLGTAGANFPAAPWNTDPRFTLVVHNEGAVAWRFAGDATHRADCLSTGPHGEPEKGSN